MKNQLYIPEKNLYNAISCTNGNDENCLKYIYITVIGIPASQLEISNFQNVSNCIRFVSVMVLLYVRLLNIWICIYI